MTFTELMNAILKNSDITFLYLLCNQQSFLSKDRLPFVVDIHYSCSRKQTYSEQHSSGSALEHCAQDGGAADKHLFIPRHYTDSSQHLNIRLHTHMPTHIHTESFILAVWENKSEDR